MSVDDSVENSILLQKSPPAKSGQRLIVDCRLSIVDLRCSDLALPALPPLGFAFFQPLVTRHLSRVTAL
jgi:hypothetical protein